jgi:hypothetical protein
MRQLTRRRKESPLQINEVRSSSGYFLRKIYDSLRTGESGESGPAGDSPAQRACGNLEGPESQRIDYVKEGESAVKRQQFVKTTGALADQLKRKVQDRVLSSILSTNGLRAVKLERL